MSSRFGLTGTFLSILLLAACNQPSPPPEPCNLLPADCESGKLDEEACRCIPPEPLPDPEPDPDAPAPTDYITLGRAENELEYQNSQWAGLIYELQANIWQGARDPRVVEVECPWATQPFFGMSTQSMRDFADEGFALDQEGNRLLRNLPKVNRRCNPEHAQYDPAFCNRSETRREVWESWKSAYLGHRDIGSAMRDAVQMSRCPALASQVKANGKFYRWDSVAGWCRGMLQFNLRLCQ